MQRFKLTDKKIKQAIAYLKTKKGTSPNFAIKFKDDLKVKGSKLFFQDLEVVPREKVDEVLRKELYGKKSDVPYGRDSSFHVLKKRYVGISKNAIMEFIRKQKTLGEIKAALPKPAVSGGPKLKGYTFETDLIFLRKNDLEKANKKFIRDEIKNETYFLTCCEKVTGLSNFAYVKTKEQNVVSPLVVKQCQKIAKQIGVKLKDCVIAMDSGGEFNDKLFKTKFKSSEKAKRMCPKVEQVNKQFQSNFFKILRQRKADTVTDAMNQAEKIMNNTFNKNHKLTPNEVAEEKDSKKSLNTYNSSRKQFVAGDKRKDFEVGQHVRLLVKEKKAGLDYKTYKNQTYSSKVYVIKTKTKKAVPPKYRVNGKWYLQSSLLKSAPRDEVSNELVENRTEENRKSAKKERKQQIVERVDEIIKKKSGRPKRRAAQTAKILGVYDKEFQAQVDDNLDTIEEGKELQKQEAPLAAHRKAKKAAQQKQEDKMSEKAKKYIRYLTQHGGKTTGNEKTLKYRVWALKRKMKRKSSKVVKRV